MEIIIIIKLIKSFVKMTSHIFKKYENIKIILYNMHTKKEWFN